MYKKSKNKPSIKYGPSIYLSCFSLALIKMYFVFYQRASRGMWRTCPFPVRKASRCQTAKPAGSLFECQNGGRGKGSRKPIIKIPTTLLTASPQPAFISLPRLGCNWWWGSAAWLKTRGTNLKLDMAAMSWITTLRQWNNADLRSVVCESQWRPTQRCSTCSCRLSIWCLTPKQAKQNKI